MENTIILNSGEKIEVLLQDEVSLDIDCSLRYIKSGEKEIYTYVHNVAKPELNSVLTQSIENAQATISSTTTSAVGNLISEVETEISSYVENNIKSDLDNSVGSATQSATNAYNSSVAAAASATLAENYAIAIENAQRQVDWEEIDPTSKAFIKNKPTIPSVDQSYSSLSTNAQSGTAVADAVNGKQDILVSGTNIKSINNNSILGAGNLTINGLPAQTGQSGKFLTTDGADATWGDINDKADIDLSNLNNAGTATGAGLALPSVTYDTLTLGASGSTYTAPANGYFMLYTEFSSGYQVYLDIYVNGSDLGMTHQHFWGNYNDHGRIFVPVLKGQTITFVTNGTFTNVDFKFIYAKGSEWEKI